LGISKIYAQNLKKQDSWQEMQEKSKEKNTDLKKQEELNNLLRDRIKIETIFRYWRNPRYSK
jgi:hypothetical protein